MAAPLIAIVGPTGSGKSALALRLARERSAEIVSCDSVQVFRGLDIGSAKALAAERALVPHHLVDVVEPEQPFSAALYAALARAALGGIAARGRLAIVAGGSGLYLRALLTGFFEGPARDDALRRRLERLAERFSDRRLHRLLARVDPEAAARTHANDRVRIVRALEVYWLTGRPITAHRAAGSRGLEGFSTRVVGLAPARDALRGAVVARTREMLERGLLAETRAVLERCAGQPPRALGAVGYRQALQVLRGELPEARLEQAIVDETMRFARRQMTWFRHQVEVDWHPSAEGAHAAALAWLDAQAAPGRTPALP